MKPTQYFSPDYLKETKTLTPDQIAGFLEDFRLMMAKPAATKLISLRVPVSMLKAFRFKAENEGSLYQRKIKDLMEKYIRSV